MSFICPKFLLILLSMMIAYIDMLKEMDKSDYRTGSGSFCIVYMELNRTKKTGGNYVTIEKGAKCGLPYSCNDNEMRGVIDLETGKKKAVHLRLIDEFNGMKVHW